MKLPDKAWFISWRGVQAFQLCGAALCILIAWQAGVSAYGMIDMFLAGANLAGAFYSGRMVRMAALFDDIKRAFDAMVQINTDLVESRIFQGERDGYEAPTQPRLH